MVVCCPTYPDNLAAIGQSTLSEIFNKPGGASLRSCIVVFLVRWLNNMNTEHKLLL
jgi:hypothetical protein